MPLCRLAALASVPLHSLVSLGSLFTKSGTFHHLYVLMLFYNINAALPETQALKMLGAGAGSHSRFAARSDQYSVSMHSKLVFLLPSITGFLPKF